MKDSEGCHTHLEASYFAMALIATAASSVMADSTVIWKSKKDSPEMPYSRVLKHKEQG